ncbi:glycosyl hydrolase [Gloeobacter kilaueensis]|uniref:Glycosyl hydrolase n=1 Tax=Gloeobacter kilaueensis (strain ATCC BAA-2537 / CCAP 1431/1 / ULC 316 / JS1) TaxID=1183438 RepID=U5QCX7_GLOK1|nr:glycosyl hydrolase [Gloeobacter kilaueensis]AGY56703.1 glycosyl hydrolase [Gloeobacter kilaueensis JS1]
MKRRPVLQLTAAALGALALPVEAAPVVLGLNVGTELSLGRFNLRLLDLYQAAGVSWLRVWYNWAVIEPVQGRFQAEPIAQALRLAKDRGFKILFVIWGTPAHAGSGDLGAVPRPAALAAYCRYLQANFASLVDAWEVGNEPNLSKYFAGSAAQYVETLQAAYTVLKGNLPVVAAGPSGMAGPAYWDALFAAGLEAGCDRVNLHPYRQKPEQVLALVDDFKSRAHKPLWITELGLSADGGEQAKADFLTRVLPALASRAELTFWYRGIQGEGLHPLRFGLVEVERSSGKITPLPAYYAYRTVAKATS